MFDFVYYQCNIHISITLLFKFTFTSSITSPLTFCNFNLQLFQHSFFCHSSVPCLDAYALIVEHNFRKNGLIVRKINLWARRCSFFTLSTSWLRFSFNNILAAVMFLHMNFYLPNLTRMFYTFSASISENVNQSTNNQWEMNKPNSSPHQSQIWKI